MTELPDLTVCIPTCRRPIKLFDCLRALRKKNELRYRVSIFASGQVDTAFVQDLHSKHPDIELTTRREIVGPSRARNILASNCRTTYLAYLDDDLVCTEGAIDRLYKKIREKPEGIHAGLWKEGRGYREAGQLFFEGAGKNGEALLLKHFLLPDQVFSSSVRSIQSDACLASFAIATKRFEDIAFDKKYNFYLDMFDFFLQCKAASIAVHTHADVVFKHLPGGYSTTTNRDRPDQKKLDCHYFEKKWGARPHGPLGVPQKKFLIQRTKKKLKSLFRLVS